MVIEAGSLAVLAVRTFVTSIAITGRLASGWVALRALAEDETQDVSEIKIGVDVAEDRVTETTEVLAVLALDPAAL